MLLIRRRPTAPAPAPAPAATVLRRTRPTSAPVVALPSAPQAPGRLHRVTSKNTAHTRAAAAAAARTRIDEILKLIAMHEDTIDNAVAELEKANGEIEHLMRQNNLGTHTDGHYITEIYEAVSRQSRTIDPKKFRNSVGDAAFWDSIEVSVGKAKKHLSEKELDHISDVVPPKSQGYKYRIKRRDAKVS